MLKQFDNKKLVHSRVDYIDFLKFIGLSGIIIAHVGSPAWLMMLRSFDVPLMVVLSSFLAEKTFKKYEEMGKYEYYISRFKRLVVPTWIFLTIYFLIEFISGARHSFGYYVSSYLCTRYGIGYVWVILIYMYSALVIPYCNKVKFSFLLLLYILYEVLFFYQVGLHNKLVVTTLYYIIPYGLLTYFGFNYHKITKTQKYMILLLSLAIFLVCAVFYWKTTTTLQLVSIVKYPPRLYYLSYGIFFSLGLLLFCEKNYLKIYANPIVRFISLHSLWIYLWHILLLKTYVFLHLPQLWYLKFIVVYSGALILVYIVNILLDRVAEHKDFLFLKYLRG